MQETGKIDINFLQIFIQREAKISRNKRQNRFIQHPSGQSVKSEAKARCGYKTTQTSQRCRTNHRPPEE